MTNQDLKISGAGPEQNKQSVKTSQPLGPKRLLIVDDEEDLCGLCNSYFERRGFGCNVAHDGLEAVNLLEREVYDVVVTDQHMPRMDGLQLLDWIKKNQPQVKVVMITGDNDDDLVGRALRKHVDAYLRKPFELLDLHIEIEVCLGFPDPAKFSDAPYRSKSKNLLLTYTATR